MKKIILVFAMLVFSHYILAQSVTIEPRIIPNAFDPLTDIIYTATVNISGQSFAGCQFNWTITNGTFQPSGSTTFIGGSQVTVRWNDVKAGGTLSVQVSGCNPSAVLNGNYPQTPYSILSFKNQDPSVMSGNATIPYCNTSNRTYSIDRMRFDTQTGITAQYFADGYEWTIPAGWTYADGVVSTGAARNFFNSNAYQITITPNACGAGTIRVRGFGTNASNQIVTRSNYRDLVVTRTVGSINIVANRQIDPIKCDDVENIVFTAENVACGVSYNWSLPNG